MNIAPLPDHLPVLAICGFSNAGKTTLIEQALPPLLQKKLRVAVVKHDAHRIDCDRPGKDSDRFFKAGADVYVRGDQFFSRSHLTGTVSFEETLNSLAGSYDLILVEGYKHSPLPKIWLTGADQAPPPDGLENLLAVYPRDTLRQQRLLDFIDGWLRERMNRQPFYACILLGGRSRRMGMPKHLLTAYGITWLEKISETLTPFTNRVFLAGGGKVPANLYHLPRFPDAPNCSGPLAGIISAMRWQPTASWLVVGCDMPLLSAEAVSWLAGLRRPGLWGIMSTLDLERPEPLLAVYDGRLLAHLEDLARQPFPRMSLAADHEKIDRPPVPDHLQASWTNINTPEELAELQPEKDDRQFPPVDFSEATVLPIGLKSQRRPPMKTYPSNFLWLNERFGPVLDAHQHLGKVLADAGPLDGKQVELIKLAAAAATQSEGSVHSHTKRALQAGASPDEIYHTLILLISTVGFPATAAALSWAREILEDK